MRAIAYKTDNTAYLKRVNCEPLATVSGYEFFHYYDEEADYNYYYIKVNSAGDLCEPLRITGFTKPAEAVELFSRTPAERFSPLADIQTRLECIRQAVTAGQWTSNADALFCELFGDYELAEKVRANRAAIYQRTAEEEEKNRQKNAV